ncbi:MAG TPA: hypothetical protein PK239_18660 [Chitinophagales bacterium]|nr:hypothetical protein [Chitinophagales bacterium]HRK29305.1 hypothetical protein [Chitinophagales bacterium]
MNLNAVFLFLLCFILFQEKYCCKSEEECRYDFLFYAPVHVVPIQENYSVNDTITVYANFPQFLFDSLSLQTYMVSSLGASSGITMVAIDTIGKPDAFPYFDILSDSVTVKPISYRPSEKHISIAVKEGNYQFSFKLVPKRVGAYLFGMYEINPHLDRLQDCCGMQDLTILPIINNGYHNNYQLLSFSPDTSLSSLKKGILVIC